MPNDGYLGPHDEGYIDVAQGAAILNCVIKFGVQRAVFPAYTARITLKRYP